MEKEELEKLALQQMFRMKSEEELEKLKDEFVNILGWMELISKVEGIENVEPMTFPYVLSEVNFREDIVKNEIDVSDALGNAKVVYNDQIKVPKVVE